MVLISASQLTRYMYTLYGIILAILIRFHVVRIVSYF